MRRLFSLTLLAFAASLLGCSGDSTRPSDDGIARSIVLDNIGGGRSRVDLFDDGSIEVVTDGKTLIARSKPVFSVFRDDRSRFHDPTARGDFSFDPLDAKAIEMTVADGSIRLRLHDQGNDAALVGFELPMDDGAYLGLGERFDHVDARGTVVPMFLAINGGFESGTNDAHVPVPLVIDTRGYGVFVDSKATGAFDVGATDPKTLAATFDETGVEVRIYVPLSGRALDIPGLFAKDTGVPRRPPLWSLAPMHWRNEWKDAATLLADLDQYRARHIPASTVWIDNPWQTSYNDATLDPARFGDTGALMKAIADKGFRALAWSTPYLDRPDGAPTNEAQKLWKEADAKGFLVKSDGKSWTAVGCCVDAPGMIDFTSAKASAFWEDVLAHATGAGFSGFKLDYGEDVIPSLLGARLNIDFADGETERTARSYPVAYHEAYQAALAKVRDDGFVIGRASGLGGSAHVDAIWPGDLDNGFQRHDAKHVGGLPAAIIAGQTLAASNFPSFGSDIGGFRDGMPKREALLRWAEYAAFGVIMQLGGGGDSHNPWEYDEEAATIYGALARQHMQLVPYLDQALREAVGEGGRPPIVSLPLFYPDDPKAKTFADDEYLLGVDILVAPVTEAGATSRTVYFPDSWVHWTTHELIDGGGTAEVKAPLGTPAVFVRLGAFVPMLSPTLDTLVPAKDPGIVDPGANPDVEGLWVPDALRYSVDWPSGDHADVDDNGLSITFRTATQRELFVTMVPRARGIHAKDLAAKGIPKLADEAAVRAHRGPAFAVDEKRDLIFVRVDGVRDVVFHEK